MINIARGVRADLRKFSVFQGFQTTRSRHNAPFRESNPKQIDTTNIRRAIDGETLDKWELTVGLEIHAQLKAEHKLFSGAQTSTNDHPNTHVAPFDFALPGSQPVISSFRLIYVLLKAKQAFQNGTLLPAIRAALALNCRIQNQSSFDRKHYFYADQPAGYQITQYYHPFATNGSIVLRNHDGISSEDGEMVNVGIKQIQLEQDTAKTILQPPDEAHLDFNRVSHPLIEIITLPQIHRPQTAAACVKKIQALLQAVNAASTGMELGGLRADVNVSIRPRDVNESPTYESSHNRQAKLGQRTEIKNLSSIKAVEDAIIAERDRQIFVLENGGVIAGETRGWTLGASDTVKLRGKEGEVDYRYMPDPDLGRLILSSTLIDKIAERLPRLPDENIQDLVQRQGLTIKDAKTLVDLDEGERLEYFDTVCEEYAALRSESKKSSEAPQKAERKSSVTIANWTLHELGGLLSAQEVAFTANKVPARDLAYIVMMLEDGKLSGRIAKQLLARKFNGDAHDVKSIIEREDLMLEDLPEERYVSIARDIIAQNPVMAAQIKEKGQVSKLGFFIGQIMRHGHGKLVATRAEATLRRLLEVPKQSK
ncbi:MAG: hypothetical protein Q9216_007004 [Gyalolechia sp. 2 TL-2023]